MSSFDYRNRHQATGLFTLQQVADASSMTKNYLSQLLNAN